MIKMESISLLVQQKPKVVLETCSLLHPAQERSCARVEQRALEQLSAAMISCCGCSWLLC